MGDDRPCECYETGMTKAKMKELEDIINKYNTVEPTVPRDIIADLMIFSLSTAVERKIKERIAEEVKCGCCSAFKDAHTVRECNTECFDLDIDRIKNAISKLEEIGRSFGESYRNECLRRGLAPPPFVVKPLVQG